MTTFELTFPGPDGVQAKLDVASGQLLFVLGANGTGKSTLMQVFASQHRGKVRRLTAHRQVWFHSDSIDITPHGRRQTETQISNSDHQAQSRWRDDHAAQRSQAVVFDLIDSENVEARKIADAARTGDMARVKELAVAKSPIATMNDILRVANLDIQVQVREESRLMASRPGHDEYSIAELSDGERNALLIAANVLTAPAETLMLIDEPERHLHRAVVSPLITTLLAHRPDCAFVVSTHDVALPLDQAECSGLLVRNYSHNPQQWTTDLVEGVEDLDEQIAVAILGSRRRMLFVEGKASSLDLLLYQILFPSLSIRTAGTCVEVERSVRGLRAATSFHWLTAIGLVDRDNRSDADCAELEKHGVVALEQYSVESLYYHPQTIREVAHYVNEQPEGVAERALDALIEAVQMHQQRLAARLVERRIRNELIRLAPDSQAIENGHAVTYFDGGDLYARELALLHSMIEARDSNGLVSRYPVRETPAPTQISQALGFRTSHNYEQAVRRMLSESPDAIARMRNLVTPLVEMVKCNEEAT